MYQYLGLDSCVGHEACNRQFTDYNNAGVIHDTVTVKAMWCVKLTTIFISQAEFGGWLFSDQCSVTAGGNHWSKAEERKQEKDTETERERERHINGKN